MWGNMGLGGFRNETPGAMRHRTPIFSSFPRSYIPLFRRHCTRNYDPIDVFSREIEQKGGGEVYSPASSAVLAGVIHLYPHTM